MAIVDVAPPGHVAQPTPLGWPCARGLRFVRRPRSKMILVRGEDRGERPPGTLFGQVTSRLMAQNCRAAPTKVRIWKVA